MKTCLIGAGAAGLATARALEQAGLDFDWYERANDVGGIWRDGTYDSVHLISSRNTSAFPDLPMPADWPNFPGRDQVLSYLHDYAARFRLTERITFHADVQQVHPCDSDGSTGWQVELADGTTDRYDSVVAANGHLWNPRVPHLPGQFTGRQIHSRDYHNPTDLAGRRVLVVGAGNSACDIAVDTAQHDYQTCIAIRRGHWFVPKSLFGVPRAEIQARRLPAPLRRCVLRVLADIAIGRAERYGLPRPDHQFDSEPPTINSQLFFLLDHGELQIKPAPVSLDNDTVKFADGTVEQFDTIIWATGFAVTFPFLDEKLLDWDNGIPKRLAAGTLAPNLTGLYFAGLITPAGGNFPIHHAQGRLIAKMITAQARHPGALSETIFAGQQPSARMYFPVPEILAQVARAERRLARHQHTARSMDRQPA